MPEGETAPNIILPEDLLPAADIEQLLDESESESEEEDPIVICDCKRLTMEYEDVFDPDLSRELPSNEKMDEMILQYQDARDHCTICPALEEPNEAGCTCEKFERFRADVLRCQHYYIIEYYSAENIPSTELEWYYQRDRCQGCKERRKKKVLCYRKWTKDGRTFRIADYLPNSYDRYRYSS